MFIIVHRAGISNGDCDSLSRKPCERDDPDQMCFQCRPRSARQAIMADSCRVIQTIVGGSSETGVDYGSTVTQTETTPVKPPVTGNEGLNDVRNTQLFDAAGDLSVEILQVEQQQDSIITRTMGC